MADEERVEQGLHGKVANEEATALDRVTDFSEGREIGHADTSNIQKSMAELASQQAAAREAQRIHERELAAVKVAQHDIDLLVQEFEIDKRKAERCLRECKGDVQDAMESLIANPLYT